MFRRLVLCSLVRIDHPRMIQRRACAVATVAVIVVIVNDVVVAVTIKVAIEVSWFRDIYKVTMFQSRGWGFRFFLLARQVHI